MTFSCRTAMILDSDEAGRNDGTQNLYAIIDALHPRCPDEHRMYRAASDAIKIDIGLEGLHLTTEGVASYGDIQCTEGLLIFCAVKHPLREQDHPGAGAVRRQSGMQAPRSRAPAARRSATACRWWWTRHRAARSHPARRARRAAYGSDVRAARRQHAEMLAYVTLQGEDTDNGCAAHQPR